MGEAERLSGWWAGPATTARGGRRGRRRGCRRRGRCRRGPPPPWQAAEPAMPPWAPGEPMAEACRGVACRAGTSRRASCPAGAGPVPTQQQDGACAAGTSRRVRCRAWAWRRGACRVGRFRRGWRPAVGAPAWGRGGSCPVGTSHLGRRSAGQRGPEGRAGTCGPGMLPAGVSRVAASQAGSFRTAMSRGAGGCRGGGPHVGRVRGGAVPGRGAVATVCVVAPRRVGTAGRGRPRPSVPWAAACREAGDPPGARPDAGVTWGKRAVRPAPVLLLGRTSAAAAGGRRCRASVAARPAWRRPRRR